jgi:predicted Zn-dependent peptidase
VRKEWIAGIQREKTNPEAVATRVLPPLLYGDGHPYAIPFTGTGTEASIAALTRDDLTSFQRDWLRPDNATVVVTGDTTLERVDAVARASFRQLARARELETLKGVAGERGRCEPPRACS